MVYVAYSFGFRHNYGQILVKYGLYLGLSGVLLGLWWVYWAISRIIQGFIGHYVRNIGPKRVDKPFSNGFLPFSNGFLKCSHIFERFSYFRTVFQWF